MQQKNGTMAMLTSAAEASYLLILSAICVCTCASVLRERKATQAG